MCIFRIATFRAKKSAADFSKNITFRIILTNLFYDEDGPRPVLSKSSNRPRFVLVLVRSSSLTNLVLVPSSSHKSSISLVPVLSRPEDELGRGPSEDRPSRPTDPWSGPLADENLFFFISYSSQI